MQRHGQANSASINVVKRALCSSVDSMRSIASEGARNASIDVVKQAERVIRHTGTLCIGTKYEVCRFNSIRDNDNCLEKNQMTSQ